MVTEQWIRELIQKDELWRFYKSPEWIQLKRTVLRNAHYECAECRKLGKVTRWDVDKDGVKHMLSTVHHVCHVKKHPKLAMSRYYRGTDGQQHVNLIPVCKACHNKLHPEKMARKKTDGYTNVERW